jgi:hypothetical protein
MSKEPPTFQVTLRAARGADDAAAIRGLRAILKILLGRYGFRAIDAHEVHDRPDDPRRP